MGGFDSALANLTMMSARPSPSTSPAGDRAVMPDPPGAAISVTRLPKPATLARLGGAACDNGARSGSARSGIHERKSQLANIPFPERSFDAMSHLLDDLTWTLLVPVRLCRLSFVRLPLRGLIIGWPVRA